MLGSLSTIPRTCNDESVLLVTARKQSLGQGNVFRNVCHSVHKVILPLGGLPPGVCIQGGLSPGEVCVQGRCVDPQNQKIGWCTSYWNAFLLFLIIV